MEIKISIEKKHVWVLAILMLMLGISLVLSTDVIDSQPWHILQQIRVNSTSWQSVDSNGNGIIDKADSAVQAVSDTRCDSTNDMCNNIYSLNNITAYGTVFSGGGGENNKVCTKGGTNCPSGRVDTLCNESGRCDQLCIGDDCRRNWPGSRCELLWDGLERTETLINITIPQQCRNSPCLLVAEQIRHTQNPSHYTTDRASTIYIPSFREDHTTAFSWISYGSEGNSEGINGNGKDEIILSLGQGNILRDDRKGVTGTVRRWIVESSNPGYSAVYYYCTI